MLINGLCIIPQRVLLGTQSCEMCREKNKAKISGQCCVPNNYLKVLNSDEAIKGPKKSWGKETSVIAFNSGSPSIRRSTVWERLLPGTEYVPEYVPELRNGRDYLLWGRPLWSRATSMLSYILAGWGGDDAERPSQTKGTLWAERHRGENTRLFQEGLEELVWGIKRFLYCRNRKIEKQ